VSRLRSQAKFGRFPCDKTTRRANHEKPVQPLAQKYFASVVGQISDLNSRVPPDQRGRAHVTNVAAGCGGRELMARDERLSARTAKSCGPGAPMLAFKLPENVPEVKVARKPGHLGEREVSRKTTAQGKPVCSGSPVVLPPCFSICTGPMGAIGTRLSLRPLFYEARTSCKARARRAARMMACVCCLTIESDVSARPAY